MELFHQITAVWIGTDEPGASCVLQISIDISKIQGALQRFDFFTITKVVTEYKDFNTNAWKTAEYEFTKLHRSIAGTNIEFQVTIYGDAKNLVIKSCNTKGYYVCREG